MERKASALSAALGAVVRGRYRKAGISQETLAARSGLTLTTVQRLVAGKAEFDVDQMYGIAEALSTTPSALIAEAERDLRPIGLSDVSSTPISIHTKRSELFELTTQEIEAMNAAANRDPQSREDPIS